MVLEMTLIKGISFSWEHIFTHKQRGGEQSERHNIKVWSGSGPWSSCAQSGILWDVYCPIPSYLLISLHIDIL